MWKWFRLIDPFLSDRFQSVLLNCQTSKWSKIKPRTPQGSILGPLLFLMYINDLPEGLTSNAKLFVDDSSIFSVADDSISSSLSLNEELSKILQWAYKLKIFLILMLHKKPTRLFSHAKIILTIVTPISITCHQ